MRHPHKKRPEPKADRKYGSVQVSKFINALMYGGKKSTAERVVYDAFKEIEAKNEGVKPLEVFEAAMRNVGPTMEVRSRRIGGANYAVPRPVPAERRQALAFRWILEAARKKKGSPMSTRLANELIAASKEEGEAIAKRDNVHKMAEANKAFAHFAQN
ncbi:MAG: 30S ribosomal protein S7 [Candidatus Yonathbacteria bacterium]|nr:30S ribosomal protein S7 [Candidatus Yonathbacteria bacterium]